MRIGWIDFSKEERNKVLSVIDLLSEDGTLDELGIAPVRDGFADLFFPGTSTIQTRAKYFLIVPYALAELSKTGLVAPRVLLERLNATEHNCGKKLTATDADGVIGSRSIKSGTWVKRTPVDIYWAGIRRYGIFTGGTLSLSEYARVACALNSQRTTLKRLGNRNDDADEYECDDIDAGSVFSTTFWNLPEPPSNWMDKLSMELTPLEASFLRRQIIKTQPGSMMAYILKTGNSSLLELGGFQDLQGAIAGFPEQMQRDYWMALGFANFIYGVRIRYNIILSQGKNEEASEEWTLFSEHIDEFSNIDIDAIFLRLNIVNSMLRRFLHDIQLAMHASDIDVLDERIYKRECQLKGTNRAKLNRAGEFSPDSWIGGRTLDYRFRNAAVILRDIFEGLEASSC